MNRGNHSVNRLRVKRMIFVLMQNTIIKTILTNTNRNIPIFDLMQNPLGKDQMHRGDIFL